MPQPEFLDDDFINPEAPEDECHLRPDHPSSVTSPTSAREGPGR
ncbi:hypothetical protein ABT236_38045 [Streptomyces sp. NPDC001523]